MATHVHGCDLTKAYWLLLHFNIRIILLQLCHTWKQKIRFKYVSEHHIPGIFPGVSICTVEKSALLEVNELTSTICMQNMSNAGQYQVTGILKSVKKKTTPVRRTGS